MAAARRTQPSSLVSTGLSAATLTLNVAGAATDAVPIVKQILNSAAHISAAAERIQKKREAMYTLVEKSSIYATQINTTVDGRVLDAALQRRLERLFIVFEKIEALVEGNVVGKNGARARVAGVWQKLIAKPNLAETLAAELDREIQLFQLVTGVQQTLTLGDVARVVAADVRYDGQFRLLRDCDVQKLGEICRRNTEDGVIVWASARVDGQPMVIRYVDTSRPSRKKSATVDLWPREFTVPYKEFIETVKKFSAVEQSHRLVAQLYGYHVQVPHEKFSAFRAGGRSLRQMLLDQRYKPGWRTSKEEASHRLRVAFQLLEASWHLKHVHGLVWMGRDATMDEFGEPHIGLFDDVVPLQSNEPFRAFQCPSIIDTVFLTFHSSDTNRTIDFEQIEVDFEQIDDAWIDKVFVSPLICGGGHRQRVLGAIRRKRLRVHHVYSSFPVVSENLTLSQATIDKGLQYFDMLIGSYRFPSVDFMRAALRGYSNTGRYSVLS